MLSFMQITVDYLFQHSVLGNTYMQWIAAFCTLVLIMAGIWVVKRVVAKRLRKIAQATTTRWDDLLVDIVEDIRLGLVLIAAAAIAAQSLNLSHNISKGVQIALVIAVGLQLILACRLVVDFSLMRLMERSRTETGEPDPTLRTSMVVLRFVIMLILGVLVLLLGLENLGVQIGPMLTGLGIGGIAIALAVQRLLGDILASVSILLDKPFVVGDFIVVGDKMGTVETIGIKTTRVRAISGEELIFGNSDLLSSRVQNFKRMTERRVAFTVGVLYETPIDSLRLATRIIRGIIERESILRFSRCHVKTLNAYSIDIETVFFVLSGDHAVYMDVQERVLLDVVDAFRKNDISFAYPTAVELQKSID